MDYPKSVANVGLVDGKFVDENTVTGVVGSLIPAEWGNAVTDELLAVVNAAGLTPLETDATQLLKAIRTLHQVPVGPSPRCRIVAGAAATTASVTDDTVVVRDSAGAIYTIPSFAATLKTGTVGINGMDTGAATANGFILVYAAYNPTSGAYGVFGTMEGSAVATSYYTGAAAPSGYTATALIGILRVGSTSGQFVQSVQAGRRVQFARFTLASGTTTVTTQTWVAGLNSALPYNTVAVSGMMSVTIASAGTAYGGVASYSNTVGSTDILATNTAGGTANDSSFADLILSTPRTVYYYFSSSSASLTVQYAVLINGFTF